MINDFLNIQVLLAPESYSRLQNLDSNDFSDLFNKIKEFKSKKDDFILLDSHFLNIFLGNNLKNIFEEYGKFDFLAYYTSNEVASEEQDRKSVV